MQDVLGGDRLAADARLGERNVLGDLLLLALALALVVEVVVALVVVVVMVVAAAVVVILVVVVVVASPFRTASRRSYSE